MFNFIKNISPVELVILIIILIVLFGRKTIISLGRTSGETVREMKKIKKEFTKAFEDDDSEPKKK